MGVGLGVGRVVGRQEGWELGRLMMSGMRGWGARVGGWTRLRVGCEANVGCEGGLSVVLFR